MTQVYLSLGANIDREYNLAGGLTALAKQLGKLELSPVYESEAVGFDGPPFLNFVVGFDTDLSVAELVTFFHQVEADHGRVRGKKCLSSRTLDIDILTYGNACGCVDGVSLPRAEIVKYAFVLRPLRDLAPDALHPACHQSYAELWRALDTTEQALWQVPFDWQPPA